MAIVKSVQNIISPRKRSLFVKEKKKENMREMINSASRNKQKGLK